LTLVFQVRSLILALKPTACPARAGWLPCCTPDAEPKMHTLEKTMQRASPLGAQADCCTVFLFPAGQKFTQKGWQISHLNIA